MYQEPRILLVDDERELTGITKEYLEARGFNVTMRHNAVSGLEEFKPGKFDICILDVKMPFKDGFSLAEDIRALDSAVPIIFLTGQSDKEARIKGLTLGADDYVTKPFSMEELYLRLKVALRRMQNDRPAVVKDVVQLGNYTYNPVSRTLTLSGNSVRLSEMEGQLLMLFCTQPERQVSRDLALSEVWHDEDHVKSRSLNVYISKLRNHFKEDNSVEIINVHGAGYRLIVKDDAV